MESIAADFLLGGCRPVRRLGFGTGWRQPIAADHAAVLLRRAAAGGINLIDTADVYGPDDGKDGAGFSENIIRTALHPYSDGLVIATKGGLVRSGAGRRTVADGTPEHLRRACEASLQRLGTDRIPLYMLHVPDPRVPLAESVGALVDLRDAGKIDLIGLCNVSASQLAEALTVADIAAVQNRFDPALVKDDPVLRACETHSIALMLHQPFARGALLAVGQEAMAQALLAFLVARSPVTIPIPSTSSLTHLEANVAALRPATVAALKVPPAPRMPSVPPAELNTGPSAAGIAKRLEAHGCVLVSGLFDAATAAALLAELRSARADVDAGVQDGSVSAAFAERYRSRGSVDLPSLPALHAPLLALLRQTVLPDAARQLFGAPAALALDLSYVRWVDPVAGRGYGPCHQDGWFLDGRSINVCLPLTGYGGDYPGLKLMPGVRERISEQSAARMLAGDAWVPLVAPGDVLIFDTVIPHRRDIGDSACKERVNIEARLVPVSSEPSESRPTL